MRYIIVLISFIALVAFACGGDGDEQQPTATSPSPPAATGQPSPPAGELDMRDLMLRPEDVPLELGQLQELPLGTAQEVLEEAFGLADRLDAGEITEQEVAAWQLQSAAMQVYNSAKQYPAQGAQFMLSTVVLHGDIEAAAIFLAFAEGDLDRSAVEEYEAFPGREVIQYEELDEPTFGDESRVIHFTSDADTEPRLENYQLVFRHDRAVALLWVRAPEGNVTLEQVEAIASKLEGRIREALR